MINLLPIPVRKELLREHRLRALTVALLLGVGVLVLFALMLLPAWLHLQEENKVVAQDGQRTATSTDFASQVRTANADARLLLGEEPTLSSRALTLVEQVRTRASTGDDIVRVMSFTYATQPKTTMQITGVARTREALRRFVVGLEAIPGMVVDAPVSNFLAQSNLPFALTLTFTKL